MNIDPPLAVYRTRPELMAPAGDWDCARAAVENGADAVYFGLQGGFNARARAANFALSELPELLAFLHVRGVKGYLTFNTLVFRDELEQAEQAARAAINAGIDAVLVQDLGMARLLSGLCPGLPLHASTQMTLSSAECIAQVESLGIRRVVLPRELSIDQIAAIRRQTSVELEAFVHGALCISYSGQCLASLGLGGRSANRGQCAQPCRLPYELVIKPRPAVAPTKPRPVVAPEAWVARPERAWCAAHGATAGRGVMYPLSPHDLAAHDRIDQLIAAGVSALKIEGRLKSAEYVAGVTRFYRAKIDAVAGSCQSSVVSRQLSAADSAAPVAEPEIHPSSLIAHPSRSNPQSPNPNPSAADLEAFSRGFCRGWLDGRDDRALVSGASSSKRGVYLGQIEKVRGQRVAVRLAAPVQRGDGVVFEGDRSRGEEIGGRVYEVFRDGRSLEGPVAAGLAELAFRHGTIDPNRLSAGQKLWKTDEPQLRRRLQKTYAAGRYGRRVPVDIVVEAAVGRPLVVLATAATGAASRVSSPDALPEAVKHPLTVETLTEQFGRLGNTPFELRRLEAKLDGRPMCPLSVLATVRHAMVEQLQAAASQPPQRVLAEGSALASLRGEEIRSSVVSGQWSVADSLAACPADRSHLHVLCRRPEQIAAALRCGVSSVIADFQDLRENRDAVRAARDAGAKILLATPRIQKPQAADIFQRLADQQPDGLLVRNLAGLGFCGREGLPAVADFSLHAVNDLSFAWLCRRGACRVTAAYDLNVPRLLDLASAVESSSLEVVVDRHTPLFHTEYCLCARGDTSSLGSTSLSPSEGRGLPGGTSSLGGTSLSPSEGRGVDAAPHAVGQGSGRATQSAPCRQNEIWLRGGTSSLGGTSLSPSEGRGVDAAPHAVGQGSGRATQSAPCRQNEIWLRGGTSSLGGTSLSPSEGRGVDAAPHAVGQGSGRATQSTPCRQNEIWLRGSTSSLGGTPLSPSEGRGVDAAPHAVGQGSGRATQSAPCRQSEIWLRGSTSSLGGTPLSPSEGRGVDAAPHAVGQGSGRATQSTPCRQSEIWLRDRRGVEHPVWVDADCRTTVFHAEAQSLAAAVPDLLARGVRHYRIELLSHTAGETRRTIETYLKLL